jgi:hypothetical protein
MLEGQTRATTCQNVTSERMAGRPHKSSRARKCKLENTKASQWLRSWANFVIRISQHFSVRISNFEWKGTSFKQKKFFPDVCLTVHHSITLVNLQIEAQNSYSFTYNIIIKILYMFQASLCSSSGGLHCNYIYAASGIVTLCRWRYQRLNIYNYDVDLLTMSRVMLETCRGF